MQNFRHMHFKGVIRSLLTCDGNGGSIASKPLKSVYAALEGFPEDTHSGLTRKACTRFPYLYSEGTVISNSRQLSIVSTEELSEIAEAMEILELLPGWLGANIELEGIPNLTLMPPSTRLVFDSKATLVVDLENRPCSYPAQIINQHFPGKGRKFVKQAMHKRGITARVEREGSLQCGDCVEVFFPQQALHPLQVQS